MESSILKLIEATEHCLLPKLTNDFYGNEAHPEYDIWLRKLDQHFPKLLQLLGEVDLNVNLKLSSSALASLLILYHELKSSGPWSTTKSRENCSQLNCHFELLYQTKLVSLLHTDTFAAQEIFDECLEILHQKISVDHKRCPSLVEVYCYIIHDLQSCNVSVNPLKTLPISLLLIEDYVTANKLKGLTCCGYILECLSEKDFMDGNYYEVVYGSHKKTIAVTDIEVTKLLAKCLLQLLNILPSNIKITKTDEVYSKVLDQLATESNLYRKTELFIFTKHLIQIHGVNCAKKNVFKTIVCDSLDVCCDEAVGEIVLRPVLECLEEWIKHCWCIWQLSRDQKILSVLFKCLYACKEDNAERIIYLIATMINLCSDDEKNKIIKNLYDLSQIKNEQFHRRTDELKKCIVV